MSAAETLDDALAARLAPADAPAPDAPDEAREAWRITDLGGADWAARKARAARRQIEAAQAERDRIVAEADAWLERQSTAAGREAEFFEGKLIAWLHDEIAENPEGKKSRDLPSGVTVKRNAGRESLVVSDERALAEWLESQEDTRSLVKSWDPKIDKAAVKKLVTSTGEVPPGATLERGADSYSVVIP